MNEFDIRRLAAISAINALIEGMKAENDQRKHLDQSMAYTDADFAFQFDNLKQLAVISNDNLNDLINSF